MTETFLLFRKNHESTEYDISGFCGTFICQSLLIIIVFMIYIYIYIYIYIRGGHRLIFLI